FQNNSSQLLGGAWQATSSVGTFLTGAAVCLFATFFFLYDGEKIFRWAMRLLPLPAQPVATGASERGWTTLVQYVRVQVLVAGVDAIGIGIGAAFLGIPLVIPMTVLVFLASFVPVVGAIASGVVAVLVALVSTGPVSALIMLGVVLAVQQIESQILQPFLMGKAVSVHPLAVILAVTAGGFLFGIVGALFAVPLVAVLNTVVTYIVRAKNPNSASDGEGDEAAAVLERAKDKLDTAVHEAAIEESDGDSTKGDSRTD
ncbi:MAG: AI-2E family transporter, partial [Brevibacterium aurantiacum]|nr:AI-2E family transporter [Brevibacterium aurantiacum]